MTERTRAIGSEGWDTLVDTIVTKQQRRPRTLPRLTGSPHTSGGRESHRHPLDGQAGPFQGVCYDKVCKGRHVIRFRLSTRAQKR